MKTRTKIILWTLPLWIIAGTILYIFLDGSGLNRPWVLIGKPSEKFSEIIGFNLGTRKLYATTRLGEIYSIQFDPYEVSLNPLAIWMKDNSYKKEYDPNHTSGVGPANFLTPPSPFKRRQIYQFENRVVEGSSQIVFALSDDGNIWQWAHGSSVYQGLLYMLILGIEGMVYAWSFILYLAIRLIRRTIHNRALKRDTMRPRA